MMPILPQAARPHGSPYPNPVLPPPPPHPPAAFTLIELLVVFTVVTLIASLSLPALGRAQRKTRATQCLHNLRQWGLATHLFAADNDDRLPRDGSPNGTSTDEGWYIDLPRALGIPTYHELPWRTNAQLTPPLTLWLCPANRRRSNGANLFHYCLNSHVNGSGTGRQIRLSNLPHPTRTVWIFDNGKAAAVAQHNNVHTNLHSRGAQFLFLDGHAARFPNRAYWDFTTDRGRTNHPDLAWFP